MCGIAAVTGDIDSKQEKLYFALSKMEHRGDHHFEIISNEQIAIGANRLAIVDESDGQQPKANEDSSVLVVQNGEIFNYKMLLDELERDGHSFSSQSDTEVLVHLWEECKEQMLGKLDSEMFAFVLFDRTDQTIFAARDRLGVKPLYYAKMDKGYLFSSEIKGLVEIEGVDEINEFPPGHYFLNGKFVQYYQLPKGDKVKEISEDEAVKDLSSILESAVKKRVDTELPVGVFLSGGVDSSFVMELATRHHSNVTALVLGTEDSSDFTFARDLCERKGWKYHSVIPEIDYERMLSDIVYHLESFDPNAVRHSFANDAISKLARDKGFKVILTGEGSDELFAGYNEFLEIEPDKVNLGCRLLLESMSRGHLMRVDKLAMCHTIETRVPFFDNEMVEFAMSLSSLFKVGSYNGKKYTKLILRKAALDYLPENIVFRQKEAFANGAGMQVGFNYKKADGILSEIARKVISNEELEKVKKQYSEYKLETKEEVLIFNEYAKFGYTQFAEGRKRLIMKDTLLTI